MNLYLITQAFVSLFTSLVLLYLFIRGILTYKNDPRKDIVIYSRGVFALSSLSMFIYSITPFVKEGQIILAEIALGGSLVLIQIVVAVFVQYWHSISGEVPVVSKLFYLSLGASFAILVSTPNPWEIYYMEGFGYVQRISVIYLIVLTLALFFAILILLDNLLRVRRVIRFELKYLETINSGNHKNIANSDESLLKHRKRLLNNQKRVIDSKRSIDIITFFWVVGSFLVIIGILIQGPNFNLDSIGVLFIFLPQAYFFTKDRRLLALMQVQELHTKAKQLNERFSSLDTSVSSEFSKESVQALSKFIEKADALLYFQEQHD